MTPYVLTVTVNPAVDKFIEVDRLRFGHDHRVGKVRLTAGGKGINVARALKLLGVPVMATGVWGGPTGRCLKTILSAESLPYDFVEIPQDTRTNVTITDISRNRVTRIQEPGPVFGPRARKIFQQKLIKHLKRCSYVVFSGSCAPGVPDRYYAGLIRLAGRMKCKAILDTSGNPLREGTRAKPFMIKPNRAEAEAVLGKDLASPSSWKGALRSLLARGARTAVISLDSRGAVASDGKDFFLARAPRVKVYSAVGSGDTFIAGFVCALIRGCPFAEALRTAVAAGTANARQSSPGCVTAQDMACLARKVVLKPL